MNDLEDILQWVDQLMLDKTGKNLTSIQSAILRGSWEGKKYPQIAEDFHCSESHIKKEASKLWNKLREELGDDLNKFNFRSKVEKQHRVSPCSQSGHCLVQVDNVNIGGELIQTIKDSQQRSPSPPDSSTQHPSPIIDLSDAPELTDFYNRTTELSTLKQWILEDRTRLITIYGVSEIGKSTLTLKLIEDIQTEFDAIIWRSLSQTPTLSTLQTELKEFLAPSPANPSATVIDIFRQTRCLVILDDVQNIFASGQLAGEYLTDYKDYGKFFKQIARTQHYSCVILLSWEKPREIATLEGTHRPTRSLHLKGLDSEAEAIFREQELTDEEHWPELINLYQGHPVWLTIIAATIRELFEGQVAQFLADPPQPPLEKVGHRKELYLGDLEPILEAQLERLSEVEQRVMAWLGSQEEGVDLSVQLTHSEFSRSELLEGMQSLGRRGLVEKRLVEERSHFYLHPLWQQYLLEIQ
ncbi:NB-ARC domain-containing protein [Roseofilum capinflatum]|uniref:NB-ARC domain-containing protein n=1 Tax=Roseofilum capinflatum BLCC-M114 TaxID=3022440 RepID=A0ABT7B484_9CYAN|nr:NB-ARC domain-containing protein [Roseofilum capinflatum]MDJ1173936.1 NB-ARC domain-containing protein [Roseofilum capinflatum BLCC-M114]